MGQLSDVTLGEIVTAGRRYRPVLVAFAIVALVLAVLPEPARRALNPTAADRARSSGALAVAGSEAGVPEGEVATISDAFDYGTVGSEQTFEPFSSSEGDFDSSKDETFSFTIPEPSERPLRVVAKAWATQTAGTPLAAQGVPAGTLPVGTRFGRDDKRSFIRLDGTESRLIIGEDAAGARTTTGAPAVQACQITDIAWKEAEAVNFDQAPKYEATACVKGTRSDNGVWTFDFSAVPTRADQRGFALVPAPGASIDFQVAFRPTS